MATRTFGASAGNWSDPTKWVEGAKPTASDDVVFNGSSANCVMDELGVWASFDSSAYAGTQSGTFGMTQTGPAAASNVKLGGTITCTGLLTLNAAAGQYVYLYCNGKTWGGGITTSGAGTVWRADATACAGAFTAGGPVLSNGFALTAATASIGAIAFDMASCLVTLSGSGAVWAINASATLTATGSTIALTYTGTTASTFAGGAFTYGIITLSPGPGTRTFSGAFTFVDMTNASAGPQLVKFTKAVVYTQTGSNFLTGTADVAPLVTGATLNGNMETRGVNGGLSSGLSTATRACSSNVATLTTAAAHGLTTGNVVTITAMTDATYNAAGKTVTVTGPNSFTYALTHANEPQTADTAGRIATAVFGSWAIVCTGASTVNAEPGVDRYAGTYSCRLDIDGSNSVAQIYQSILTGGKVYKVTFWAKCSSGTCTMRVTSSSNGTAPFTLTTTWQQFTGYWVADNTNVVFSRTSATGKSIYLDNIVIAETNAAIISSDTAGQTFTLRKLYGSLVCNYLALQDSIASGGAPFTAGANSVNMGNNTGWLWAALASRAQIGATPIQYDVATNGYFDVTFTTLTSGGVPIAPDALPTYSVFAENSATAVASGNCALVDAPTIVGTYRARGQATVAGGYAVGTNYEVRVSCAIAGLTVQPTVVGRFRMVSADVVRQDQTMALQGTATAGAALSITVSGGSAVDDYYKDLTIAIRSGTGAGQARVISAYAGATGVCSVIRAWGTAPDSTSVYEIFNDKISVRTGSDGGVLVSSGTGSGQLSIANGIVAANWLLLLGSTVTAQMGAAIVRFFAVANPTGTVNSLPDAVPGATGGVSIVGSKMDLVDAPNITARQSLATSVWNTLTGSITAAGTYGKFFNDLFSGMTSLPKWLRGLYRKSAMDATAKAEINTGGGTYDETTDSQEAQADRASFGTVQQRNAYREVPVGQSWSWQIVTTNPYTGAPAAPDASPTWQAYQYQTLRDSGECLMDQDDLGVWYVNGGTVLEGGDYAINNIVTVYVTATVAGVTRRTMAGQFRPVAADVTRQDAWDGTLPLKLERVYGALSGITYLLPILQAMVRKDVVDVAALDELNHEGWIQKLIIADAGVTAANGTYWLTGYYNNYPYWVIQDTMDHWIVFDGTTYALVTAPGELGWTIYYTAPAPTNIDEWAWTSTEAGYDPAPSCSVIGVTYGNYDPATDSQEAQRDELQTVFADGLVVDGFSAEALAALQAAALGNGAHLVTLTVEDDDGDAVVGARVTVGGGAPQVSNDSGVFPAQWALDAGTYAVAVQVGAGYAASNPYSLVVASDGSVTTPVEGVIVVERLAIPTPTAPGYCAVFCVAERYTDTAATGSFEFIRGLVPSTRDVSGVAVTLVDGEERVALTNGGASINILQGAVVTLRLETPGETIVKRNVVIPATASANWEDLETA